MDCFRLIYGIYFGNSANYNLFLFVIICEAGFPYCYFYGNFVDA